MDPSTPHHFPSPKGNNSSGTYPTLPQPQQEHDGMEFSIAFLLQTFTETQWKWSTTEQEAYDIYYAITK